MLQFATCHQAAGSMQRAPGSKHFASGRQHLPRATSLLAPLRPSARRQVGECLDRRLKRLLGAGRTCAAFHGRSGESEAVGNIEGEEQREGGGQAARARMPAGCFVLCLSCLFFHFSYYFPFLYTVRVCVCARVCACVCVSVCI